MAKYTAIADTSERLLQLLRDGLVPGLLSGRNEVVLKTPGDKGDEALGLYLYDIQASDEIYRNQMVASGLTKQRFPPVYVNLYYMITAYSSGDVKYRMAQEEKLLGRVIQILHDHQVISYAEEEKEEDGELALRIRMQKLGMEEKSRIWNFGSLPYKLSLFYKVSPVQIESAKEKEIFRVTQVEMSVEDIKRRK